MQWQAQVRADVEEQKALVRPARNAPPCGPVMAAGCFVLMRGDVAGLRAAIACCKPGALISVRWVNDLEAQAAGPSPASAKLPASSVAQAAGVSIFRDGNGDVRAFAHQPHTQEA
ncbi:MAG TPA: hypothetical protein DDZ88_06515 [Verrucomicrobiales bacterium]|nr:hypothetical protein [Verrucomicrobiales bacterium]